ncbi:hypothetical protein A2U01_0001073 [Trifolium medium]|uniref:Uncharacterized protein n=1 Tax=Trifolium medium TaxID=97028 RepID=A0A392LZ80_9FABA|nr:hypothetical protein [Trifolium medium]
MLIQLHIPPSLRKRLVAATTAHRRQKQNSFVVAVEIRKIVNSETNWKEDKQEMDVKNGKPEASIYIGNKGQRWIKEVGKLNPMQQKPLPLSLKAKAKNQKRVQL